MTKRKLRKLTRTIKEVMDTELYFEDIDLTLTVEECALMLFKALFLLAGSWSIISMMIIMLS